jgi:nicotinamide-nucleotide amidase
LEFNETVYADVESFLQQRGAKMNSLNKDQALFPKSALLLRNRQGTAPGIWFEQKKRIVISLPGVPWEMKGIFNQEIKQKLIQHFDLPEIYYQTAIITGLGESQLALLIEDWENNLPENINLAYLPSPGMIRLRLGINGNNRPLLMQTIQNEVDKLHKIIPEYIISDTEVTLQEIIGKLLLINKKTLSIAESCTGGTIAQLVTSIPGSSQYFKGSVVAYANDIKTALLDVPAELIATYGAVSKEVAESMAIGVKNRLNTHYSISTTGIAGPDGGTDEKPVGTVWIAISAPDGTFSKKFTFGKERDINIQRSAMAALNMLRKIIIKYS